MRVGETLALVGESGSGKSITALSILALVPHPGRIASGSVFWKGTDLTRLSEEHWRRRRGRDIGLVLQDPSASLNPVFTVGDQITETLLTHEIASRSDVQDQMVALLDTVRVPEPACRARDYPHQLSGGLHQRVMLALAIAGRPKLLIADERTTGLDAVTQSQILELLRDLVTSQQMALLLISHDLEVVRHCASRTAVMYSGHVVEDGPTSAVLTTPGHPYARVLVASRPGSPSTTLVPRFNEPSPAPATVPPACVFWPRCHDRHEICETVTPAVTQSDVGTTVRCHLHASR